MSRTAITIRLEPDLRERMIAARNASPYQPSITAIVTRGIVLACEEIERITAETAPASKGDE